MEEDIKGTVIVYSEVGCKHCDTAKRLLSNLRIPYADISLDSFPQCREEMERLCGRSIVPQVFFNQVHIGDEQDLDDLVNDEERFEKMMEMIRNEEAPQAGAPSLPQPQTALEFNEDDEGTNSNADTSNGVFLSIPNEYSRLVTTMKKANLIKDNRVGSTIYQNSFKGEHFISWIMQTKRIKLKDALEIGQELIERQFSRQRSREDGEIFSPEKYYRLHLAEEAIALNAGLLEDASPISAYELNTTLISVLEPLYAQILTKDRKSIKYSSLEENAQFSEYLIVSKEIQRLNVHDASPNEKLAVFVNIYNIMLIHIFVKYGPPNDVWQRRKLLNSTYYVIGGELYSLQSVLNGILRGNSKGINMLWPPFGAQDRRLNLALDKPEALVHFVINCGTKSGPAIRLYSTQNVIAEMRSAACEYFSSDHNLRIDVKKSTIFLPSILKWYADDFGRCMKEVIDWVINVLNAGERKAKLIRASSSSKLNIDYLNYDWTNNAL